MNIAVNIFAVFGALIFFGGFALFILDIIVERKRKHNVNTYLLADEKDEYLHHDAEMIRIYELATNRSNRRGQQDE